MPHADEPDAQKLPGTFKEFVAKFPKLGDAHEAITHAVGSSGPLDAAINLASPVISGGHHVGDDAEPTSPAKLQSIRRSPVRGRSSLRIRSTPTVTVTTG